MYTHSLTVETGSVACALAQGLKLAIWSCLRTLPSYSTHRGTILSEPLQSVDCTWLWGLDKCHNFENFKQGEIEDPT